MAHVLYAIYDVLSLLVLEETVISDAHDYPCQKTTHFARNALKKNKVSSPVD